MIAGLGCGDCFTCIELGSVSDRGAGILNRLKRRCKMFNADQEIDLLDPQDRIAGIGIQRAVDPVSVSLAVPGQPAHFGAGALPGNPIRADIQDGIERGGRRIGSLLREQSGGVAQP